MSAVSDRILVSRLVKVINLVKGKVVKMITLNEIRISQQARYAREHAIAMESFPWIAESINAYNNATPEQLAQIEAIVSKRGGF